MENVIQPKGKELFRYARIRKPQVIDLQLRTKKVSELDEILSKSKKEQLSWAETYVKSKILISSDKDLQFDYFSYLNINSLDQYKLPSRNNIKDIKTFNSINFQDDERYHQDYKNCILSLTAYALLKRKNELRNVSRLMNLIEIFPVLSSIKIQKSFAPALLERKQNESIKTVKKRGNKELLHNDEELNDMIQLSQDVEVLWQAHILSSKARTDKYHKKLRDIKESKFMWDDHFEESKISKTQSKTAKQKRKAERARAHKKHLVNRKEQLGKLREEYIESSKSATLESLLDLKSSELNEYIPGTDVKKTELLQKRVSDKLNQYQIPKGKFCQVYEQVVHMSDTTSSPSKRIKLITDCFKEYPSLEFSDTIRLLGRADLIKVEEFFIKYLPSEISYIENILPGELRRREINNKKYFEQETETTSEEITDISKESTTSSRQELSSQIENEISTRFNSDINASANASGSGNIGVADVEGGASLSAGLGIGIDTSLSTSNESNFSQEIIDKAVEKTKKANTERRTIKSYSLFETLDIHEINNTGTDARNGIYCFLDKEICIKETTYGQRLFLLANISLPGKNLLCEKITKIRMALMEQGLKPEFDITPGDIHPDNYKDLVGKFRAANVKPPPDPVKMLARTYKTDTTNANIEQQELKFKKVADVLIPFFEQ